ncbi:MAG: hypothetical protein RL154_860 [Pseudomonadota bacterium]|jgi:hypothetical protein
METTENGTKKAKKQRVSLLDLYIDEIKEAVTRGVPTTRIAKDINAKLPEYMQIRENSLYHFIIRRGLRG